jgi:putative FmdB family regulatory protein
MRLYDFGCNQCGQQFEELVKELSEARCPACSSADVAKQLSAFAIGGSSRSQPDPAPACAGGGMCNGTGRCAFDD